MESKTEHFLFADDLAPEQTWMLLAWCQARGASEFTIDLLGLQDHPEPFCDRFRDAMAEFRLADAARENMVTYSGDPWVRPTPLWRLTPESIQILRSFLDEGLFTYPAGDWPTGCLENPTFYRAGEVMLGIVSHEREGILRLLTSEQADFGALCIPWRDQPKWI